MPFARWFIALIAFWSTCTVWAEDPLAKGTFAPHKGLYWALIAIICTAVLLAEIRSLVKNPRKNEAE